MKEYGIDFVVVGMYGWCGIWCVLFGSVVECFVCGLKCLVLLICGDDVGELVIVVVV